MRFFFLSAVMLITGFGYSQDSLKTRKLDDVIVYATRANENTSMTYSSLSKEEINKRNLGQDLPILLNFTPSIVTTSDAGAGVGYTGMRIRGSDATRINVTINGIPVNDPESHGVFWVNMPDFSSSLSSLQIQRGVGTSSNGTGAFGATVNLKTSNVSLDPFFQTDNSFGSFNTWKSNLTFNTGLINDRFNFEGRLSKITSDGYVDRSVADLKSYYLSGGSYGTSTMIKAVIFGGQEITQQAWYGTPEAVLDGDREAIENLIAFSGEYTNPEQVKNVRSSDRKFNYYLYDNEIDNYRQDHYQLHLGHAVSESLNLSAAVHYTRGRGYFEQFHGGEELLDYGVDSIEVGSEKIGASDIIVRRWLDNHFYGATFSLYYQNDKLNLTFSGAVNQYVGDHFGEIIWMQYAGNVDIRDRYYEGDATKNDINIFAKANYQINDRLNAFADMQIRNVAYETLGRDNDLNEYNVNESLTFFNPKFGLTYRLTDQMSVYGSFAIGNREPVRSDYIDANSGEIPTHETLENIELGIRNYSTDFSLEANLYFMNYKNQLVLTGAVNDVGSGIRVNVPKSYRAGIELSAIYKLSNQFSWSANLSLSRNKIEKFTEVAFDYGEDFSSFSEVRIGHEDTDIAYSPEVVAGSIFSFEPSDKLSLELLTKYVGQQYLDNTSNDERAIDSYLTNDVRIAYIFASGLAKDLRLSLLINNMLDVEYSSNGYTWGYYYGPNNLYQQNNYYPQAGRNFLVALNLRF